MGTTPMYAQQVCHNWFLQHMHDMSQVRGGAKQDTVFTSVAKKASLEKATSQK